AELLAGLVVRVGPHRGGKVHDLAVDAVADELANKAGRPARGALVDEVDDEILRLAGLIVHPDDGRVHQWLGAAFVDELLESAPHRRTPLWFAEAVDDHHAQDGLDFLGVNPVDRQPDQFADLPADDLVPLGLHDPLGGPCRQVGGAQFFRDQGGVGKFSPTNSDREWPTWSFFRLMIAVCGIGRPSGWRKSAVTANQSAMPPTMPASAAAWT